MAARESVSRGVPLFIVHAFSWAGTGPEGYDEPRRAATGILEEAVATAKRSTPGVRVRGRLEDGPADRVLTRLSRRAELVVLGDDDLATTPWLPPGSVLVQTVARAFCPVAVARGPRPPSGVVLAAVDGSPWSVQALRHAANEARRRDAVLEVVHAVSGSSARAQAQGDAILSASMAAGGDLGRVRSRLLSGTPGAALVRASAQARMIVAGPRGTNGTGLLGSVAREILHRAACPTIFVHGQVVPVQRVPGRPASRDALRR
jgi:nucleotide-binding universal stress UspA family protein